MNGSAIDPVLFPVTCIGIGGSILALVFLWLEIRCAPRWGRLVATVLALALTATGVILWTRTRSDTAVWPVLVLAVVCVSARAAHSTRVRQLVYRLVSPRVVWGVLLVASPSCAVLLAFHAQEPPSSDLNVLVEAESSRLDVGELHAMTDSGRVIELFTYCEPESITEVEKLVLAEDALRHQVIRMAGPSATSNCHGWVFTGGEYGVPGDAVELILADNGYTEVGAPAAGDVIIYRSELGAVLHTGLVRLAGQEGPTLIESKWGPLGVYLHTPESSPYGHRFRYYRSLRPNHRLDLTPAAATTMNAG
jgi:hypothetical protein